ncbi:sulfur carrier protein ThiS [Granulibacter bethesdensis]|nr:sulfur carrier protein ThiS [Granulibacter bethesdensis]
MTAGAFITVNGLPHALRRPTTVAALLEEIGLDRVKIAVERNESIIPRSLYEQTLLDAGDVLEIVHFIGGG